MVGQEGSSEKEGQEMSNRYAIATNKYTEKETRERRRAKKKKYKFYQRNKELRKVHSNIRQIQNGEVISTWDDE